MRAPQGFRNDGGRTSIDENRSVDGAKRLMIADLSHGSVVLRSFGLLKAELST
jgi:hypothetical protein